MNQPGQNVVVIPSTFTPQQIAEAMHAAKAGKLRCFSVRQLNIAHFEAFAPVVFRDVDHALVMFLKRHNRVRALPT